MSKNYYDLLKVHRNATEEEIRKAYKKAALVHHPDKGGEEEMFKKVTFDTFEDLTNVIRSKMIRMQIRKRDGLDNNIILKSGPGLKSLGVFKINQSSTNLQCQNERRNLHRMRNSDDHYVFMDFTENSKRKRKK